jgi:hypothetical protein
MIGHIAIPILQGPKLKCDIPKGAVFLSVLPIGNQPHMAFLADDEAEMEDRHFINLPLIGGCLDADVSIDEVQYLGSFPIFIKPRLVGQQPQVMTHILYEVIKPISKIALMQ